jgi:hypothetical protein
VIRVVDLKTRVVRKISFDKQARPRSSQESIYSPARKVVEKPIRVAGAMLKLLGYNSNRNVHSIELIKLLEYLELKDLSTSSGCGTSI